MKFKTLHQIQQEGLDVLVEKLGPDDAIRFLQIYEPGSGDWTKDRKKYLDNDPDKIVKCIMERRKKYPLNIFILYCHTITSPSVPIHTINFADPLDRSRHENR